MKQTGSRRFQNSDDSNRFYVYGHFTADTDELFYIGKGTAGRFSQVAGRSVAWEKVKETRGFIPKILHENLTEDQANQFESKLIQEQLLVNPLLVNSIKRFNKVTIEYDDVIKILKYDESSPSCLTWISGINKGKDAGWLGDKMWYVQTGQKTFPAHRLVYLLNNGSIDWNLPIDHIDGNSLNNKIENLRNVSVKSNNRNRIIRNETGIPFLHRKVRNNQFDNYFIKYDMFGKRITTTFSLYEFTTENATLEAAKTYLLQILPVLKVCGYPERVLNDIRDKIQL